MTHLLVERIPSSEAPWFSRFQKHLAMRQYMGALRLLERVIADDLPLFDVEEEIAADRRVAWLCRITCCAKWAGSPRPSRGPVSNVNCILTTPQLGPSRMN
jgi:hypothetical protein